MSIVKLAIEDIRTYKNNPRTHSIKQLETLVKSIKRFGFRGSILLDKNNTIVAGHARVEAALLAGLTDLPCEYANDLSESEIIAYRILDNKIAEMAHDNIEKLDVELSKIPQFNFDDFGIVFSHMDDININDAETKDPSDKNEFIVSVFCNNESEQQKVYEEMKSKGFECKLIM